MLYNILDWLRCYLPWTTRGELKETIDIAIQERQRALLLRLQADRARATSEERWRNLYQRRTDQVLELQEQLRESDQENRKLNQYLTQERVATRRLMMGLFSGLEGTLTNLGTFIEEMPDYTPRGDEQRKVFLDLTKKELGSAEDERRRRQEGEALTWGR